MMPDFTSGYNRGLFKDDETTVEAEFNAKRKQ